MIIEGMLVNMLFSRSREDVDKFKETVSVFLYRTFIQCFKRNRIRFVQSCFSHYTNIPKFGKFIQYKKL